MDLGLGGKRVIVTGASKGIGKAIAQGFLMEGARVAICARDQTTLTAGAAELSELGEVHARSADMAEPNGPASFVEWAAGQLGGLDVVVSNVSAMEASDYRAAFQTDVGGAVSLTRAALEHMPDDDDANVVFIGSRAASVGVPWMPAYAAMKAATVSVAKSMALEVARRGIRVNVVSPGDVSFPGGSWDRAQHDNPKLYEAIIKENPFRRLARPEEIADVVVFIASARASFVTGANIFVDGGATKSLQL
ncbi:SDR family NAD(P)-dependent oxidoreductase [Ilumatobacter sp.]|uniref:SDR family NAD(P)-dependent oxidoreductase n=1 Tax=Ilumatobacter sp. TaxID=1967498 RepID=UPI003AF67BC0